MTYLSALTAKHLCLRKKTRDDNGVVARERTIAQAYKDLFALCALEISGGYRHPSGISFFKIEWRMYHQVYSSDAPGQKFVTKGGDVQLVNRCRRDVCEVERLHFIRFSQTKSSAQNAQRIRQLNELLNAQRSGPAGRHVRDDIARDETVQGEGWA
ncbi:hypothetical protein J6590_088418 [Homalodisca vitripennis]|nr:hypothetical protein J6590_088418 [Homalodisca vitripennis]